MSASPLDALIALSKETSSDKRRDVLRSVTDLFLTTPDTGRAAVSQVFDGVLSGLAAEMETEVRAELATRLAPVAHAPRRLALSLAKDTITVAAPLLTRSRALTPDDLLDVVRSQGQEHLRLVSGRDDLTEAVSDVIVDRGDDATLGVLLQNAEAPISREGYEKVVDRAQVAPALHAAVVNRTHLPPDLLNEMYFVVEQRLRERIAARNEAMDPAALDAALSVGRNRLATRDGALPADYADAERHVAALMKSDGVPAPGVLAGFLRHNQKTRFLVALAAAADVDFATVRRIIERQDLDALAIICRAADYDNALYYTLAVLITEDRTRTRLEDYQRRYNELPRETAQRTLRFWRMRRVSDLAA